MEFLKHQIIINYQFSKKIVSLPEREEEKLEHDRKLEKDELEMNEVFNRKVDAKLLKLKETETNLNRNMIEEMKNLEKEKKILKELQEKFLKEKKVLKHLGFS